MILGGESIGQRQTRVGIWHRWFAWHPVWCGPKGRRRWLEYVERKGTVGRDMDGECWTYWDYRTL